MLTLQQDYQLQKISDKIYYARAVELLVALKQLGEKLSPEEEEILMKYGQDSLTQFSTASDSISLLLKISKVLLVCFISDLQKKKMFFRRPVHKSSPLRRSNDADLITHLYMILQLEHFTEYQHYFFVCVCVLI